MEKHTDSSSSLSDMNREEFVARFGGVFEHSAWIAEQTYDAKLGQAEHTAEGLHQSMATQFRAADQASKLAVLCAHPDLAGKLAAAKRLTAESTSEQAGAGLDALTDEERSEFIALNQAYTSKHGFPFIIAVKGLTKDHILDAFRTRINNDRETELSTACAQVERIALLRLTELLPNETPHG